jgi:hypothetical protein
VVDFSEPEELNNTCGKMMHVGMMDRGFGVTVSIISSHLKMGIEQFLKISRVLVYNRQ